MNEIEDYHKYAVDIPNYDIILNGYEAEWRNIDYFETREDAIKFAQEHFGADEEGRINLVTSL